MCNSAILQKPSICHTFCHNSCLLRKRRHTFVLQQRLVTLGINCFDENIIKEDKDIQIITYRILLEKFNKKYDKFDHNQKKLLKAYVNNLSNVHSLKEYISKIKPQLKKELKLNINKISNKVTKIKLTEAVNSFDRICNVESKSKIVNDSVVLQLLRYLELNKQLKNYGSKGL